MRRSQNTWLIVLAVALCSLHLIQANTPNALTDKEHKKKMVKTTSKIALADDLRYNKMLPNSLKEDDKNSTEDEYDYYYYYNEDDDDELKNNGNKLSTTESKHLKSEATTTAPPSVPIGKLKPIKGDDKVSPFVVYFLWIEEDLRISGYPNDFFIFVKQLLFNL